MQDHCDMATAPPPPNGSRPRNIAKNHQIERSILFTIQLGGNLLVLKELDLLNEDVNVYKLIGPALVKQDLAEASANIRKRIDYISAELFLRYNKEFTLFRLEKARHNMPESARKFLHFYI